MSVRVVGAAGAVVVLLVGLAVGGGAHAVGALGPIGGAGALAAAGELDPGFGGDGRVVTAFTGRFAGASGVAVQADGKIVAAGQVGRVNLRFALARYLPGGRLDPDFGGDGRVRTDFTRSVDGAFGVAVQADGKIVAAGQAGGRGGRFALARYLPGGRLDPSFGGDGKVTTDFTPNYDAAEGGLVIQPDGKIVAAGVSFGRFALARYLPSGHLDRSFGGDGRVTTGFPSRFAFASGLALAADGRIVAAGQTTAPDSVLDGRFALARYTSDGTLDTTFGGDGRVVTNFTRAQRRPLRGGFDSASGVAIKADGTIVAAGVAGLGEGEDVFDARFALAQYTPGGRLDPGFGGDGKVTTDFTAAEDIGSDLVVQADGRLVVVGEAGVGGDKRRFALARCRPGGRLDPGFGGDGKVTTVFARGQSAAFAAAIQGDGKVVAAGHVAGSGRASDSRFALARYLGD